MTKKDLYLFVAILAIGIIFGWLIHSWLSNPVIIYKPVTNEENKVKQDSLNEIIKGYQQAVFSLSMNNENVKFQNEILKNNIHNLSNADLRSEFESAAK